ncbi:MAG: HAD family hydrolase [Chloroflexota bacterium]
MPAVRIRALAVDVDGTLLDPAHRVRPAVRDAVVRLAVAGVPVILASARFPGAMRAIQAELGLLGEPMVGCQGAVVGRWVGDTFEVAHEWAIPAAATVSVLKVAGAAGLPVSRFGAHRWVVAAGDPMAAQEARIVGCEPAVVEDLAAVGEPAAKLTVMASAGREAELGTIAAALPPSVVGTISRPDYLEIVAATVSKATALAALLGDLGLPVGELAAAGDGANDVAMLQGASLRIAMGHAPASLLEFADWVVPSNGEDGLARAIDRLFDEGLVGGQPR